MGSPAKPSRTTFPYGAPAAAATVASMAAALYFSPQAPEASPGAGIAAHHAATVETTRRAGPPAAQSLSGTGLARTTPGPRLPARYIVRGGDSLSAIAARFYHDPGAWPVLYWCNRGQIRWADIIETGQVLSIPAEPARIPSPPALLDPPAPPALPAPPPLPAGSGPVQAAPVPAPAPATPAHAAPDHATGPAVSSYPAGVPGGAFGQCVISRESGGQAQVMNSSGYYGLYQFSASTWAAYGGNPADFGSASVAEQNHVFAKALAQGGQSNWAPYDGC